MHTMFKYIFLYSFLLQGLSLAAQSGFTTLGGANFLAYGRAGVNISGIEAIYLNQAGLADLKGTGLDVSFEKRYNFSELTNISLAGARAFKFGTVGVMASNFGFSEYSEQKFGIAYARRLSGNVTLGGQFDLLRYNVTNTGSKNLFSFEAGMQVQLNRDFSVAAHVFSPGKIEVTEQTDLGTRFRLGLMFKPSDKVFVIGELDKLIYRKPDFKVGFSYQVVREAQVRFGMSPVTQTWSLGAMFGFGQKYHIASAFAANGNLGNTPALSMQYQSKK